MGHHANALRLPDEVSEDVLGLNSMLHPELDGIDSEPITVLKIQLGQVAAGGSHMKETQTQYSGK